MEGSLLLLLLSCFNHVRLCAPPWTAAQQAPLSLGFSRQEHWSGLHFFLQCMKVKSESEVAQLCLFETAKDSRTATHLQFSSVAQSCPTLCDPMNCSTPGLPVHHQLPEFPQTYVHPVGDAIQPSHPLSSPSPPAPNPSQHQGLFQ